MRKKKLIKRCQYGSYAALKKQPLQRKEIKIDPMAGLQQTPQKTVEPVQRTTEVLKRKVLPNGSEMIINNYNTDNGMAGDTIIWNQNRDQYIRHHTNPRMGLDEYSSFDKQNGRKVYTDKLQRKAANLVFDMAKNRFLPYNQGFTQDEGFTQDIYNINRQIINDNMNRLIDKYTK